MESSQIIMMLVLLLMTGGMAYLIGDFHGYMRCSKEVWPLNSDKKDDK